MCEKAVRKSSKGFLSKCNDVSPSVGFLYVLESTERDILCSLGNLCWGMCQLPDKYSRSNSRTVHLFAPRILKLLTYLSRKQAWLSPPEIADAFHLDGRPVSVRTLYRWFSFLEEEVGLAYFPYPRMNLLGLANVHVRIQGARSPAVLANVPWGYSYWVEIGLDGQPFISQDYWIPAPELKLFHEYWATAKDLDLVQTADVLNVRNTHFLFSPFEEIIKEDGMVEIPKDVDNEYFADLLRRQLRRKYEVRTGDLIAASPLIVPIVLEHLWRHCSSRHVWQAIRAKGEAHVLKYAKGSLKKGLRKEGMALKLLHEQWRELLERFDDIFLQPVVFWPPGLLRNSTLVSFTVNVDSPERMVDLALRVSKRSVLTALMPGIGSSGQCRIWCNPPGNQLPTILRLLGDFHNGSSPLMLGFVDLHATRQTAKPAFCGFDWQMFDPSNLTWRFKGKDYIEKLKASVRKTSGGFA